MFTVILVAIAYPSKTSHERPRYHLSTKLVMTRFHPFSAILRKAAHTPEQALFKHNLRYMLSLHITTMIFSAKS